MSREKLKKEDLARYRWGSRCEEIYLLVGSLIFFKKNLAYGLVDISRF